MKCAETLIVLQEFELTKNIKKIGRFFSIYCYFLHSDKGACT